MRLRSVHEAFSLVELLTVMAILAILMAVTMPALNSSLQGSRLTQGTQVVLDQISLAKQAATSKNRVVEIRLYNFADSSSGATNKFYRAIQSFELQDDGSAKALDKMRTLPMGVIMASSGALSPLLGSSRVKVWGTNDTQISLPGPGTSYETRALRIRPDGSTDLSAAAQPWFLTLHAENLGDNLSSLPPNFSMIQIDPWTGQSMLYRP